MPETIRVTIKNNSDDANVLQQKLIIKGYDVAIFNAKQAVLDGTDLGGHLDYLKDVDDELFVIVAKK
jgi:hypothetical protein